MSSRVYICAGAAALLLLLLSPSLATAETVSASDCTTDPLASIRVGRANVRNGAVLACVTEADGTLNWGVSGVATYSTDDGKKYRGNTKYSVCPLAGGDCVAKADLPPGGGYPAVRLTNPGGYVLSVTSHVEANYGPFKIDNLVCASYPNKQCIARCRTCDETITATCYYKAPEQLAAAIAASPTGGVGSDDSTIIGAPLVGGQPFGANTFGASLPLRAGQTLNPRCQISSLTFIEMYSSKRDTSKLLLTLPTDGSDELVVYQEQCSALTPAQISAFTTRPLTPYQGTYLTPGGPAICKDVITYLTSQQTKLVDKAATSYSFAGDIKVANPESGVDSLVCYSDQSTGPLVQLPAASWQTSTFSVTASHATGESLCSDETCAGGNGDGACSACSYTYTVRFACNTPNPNIAPATPPTHGGSVIGDPQFVGLRGQKYQVHGLSGEVYSIVSSPTLQYNARFLFLDSGACPVINGKVQRGNCFSHPGSYLSELGLKTAAAAAGQDGSDGDWIHILAGSATQGFASVTVNERELAPDETVQLADGGSVARISSHSVSVSSGQWTFVFSNSDGFVNQQVSVSGELSSLRSHGLLGQTWREGAPSSYGRSRSQLKDIIEGRVDDYVVREKDVFGDEFKFNAFV